MSVKHAAVVAVLALGLMSGVANAATFTINFEQGGGLQPLGTFTGTLVTSKDSGYINRGNITSYDLSVSTIDSFGTSTVSLIPSNSALGAVNLSIIGTLLLFTFNPGNGFSVVDNPFTGSGIVADGGDVGLAPNITIGTPSAQVSMSYLSGTSVVLGTMSTVPLPASAPLFGAGLIALGAAGYAAKRKKAAATA